MSGKRLKVLGFCALWLASSLAFQSCGKKDGLQGSSFAGEVKAWPSLIPCRIKDGSNPELFIMTLGEIRTPIADGVFSPDQDEVKLSDGTVIPNYFKEKLNIKFFKPINKSFFKLPPSGWCSWTYYYQEINEQEFEKNAAWLAANLRDFGATYFQLDDGWQGVGHGSGNNRDWTTIDKRFPRGMAALAQKVKSYGLKPGLWLAPHGQSNPEVVSSSGAFLLDKEGNSASKTWEGDFLLDPSKPEALSYLANLFLKMSQTWGFDYFKIDGQPIVIEQLKSRKDLMADPGEDPVELYRKSLQTIRDAIGADRYLLGSWGVPLEGVGIMNGSRTGDDVVASWEGFEVAVRATMSNYFLHNIAWYSDPDVMLLRNPLTLDMARAWASLQGLTGQALMSSDRLYDLPEDRVEIMKRVYPAVDIRPFDLFPAGHFKKVWDLKISHLGRNYDVVGCFNFSPSSSSGAELLWQDLGIAEGGLVHVYDFWNKEYLGCWEKGFYVTLAPASCRVLALVPAEEKPQLISTSRHITQGWVDLRDLVYDAAKTSYRGKSLMVKNDPYELRFAFPRKGRALKVKRADSSAGKAVIRNYQGWAALSFTPDLTGEATWEVEFEPAESYQYPAQAPANIRFQLKALDRVLVNWNALYDLSAGYMVHLDGSARIYTPVNYCEISNLKPGADHEVSVYGVWSDGTVSAKAASSSLRLEQLVPAEVYLSDIEPESISSGWGTSQMDRAVTGNPLRIGNRVYKRGIGTHATSDILYPVAGMFRTFETECGVDAASLGDAGTIEFLVYGDGMIIWRSGNMTKDDPARRVALDIGKYMTVKLHVSDCADGNASDHADWAEARFIK